MVKTQQQQKKSRKTHANNNGKKGKSPNTIKPRNRSKASNRDGLILPNRALKNLPPTRRKKVENEKPIRQKKEQIRKKEDPKRKTPSRMDRELAELDQRIANGWKFEEIKTSQFQTPSLLLELSTIYRLRLELLKQEFRLDMDRKKGFEYRTFNTEDKFYHPSFRVYDQGCLALFKKEAMNIMEQQDKKITRIMFNIQEKARTVKLQKIGSLTETLVNGVYGQNIAKPLREELNAMDRSITLIKEHLNKVLNGEQLKTDNNTTTVVVDVNTQPPTYSLRFNILKSSDLQLEDILEIYDANQLPFLSKSEDIHKIGNVYLTTKELKVLKKGFKFTPTPYITLNEYAKKIEKSITRFYDNKARLTERALTKISFARNIRKALLENKFFNELILTPSLNKKETKILKSVKEKYIFRQADKNLGIAAISKEWYRLELEKHLEGFREIPLGNFEYFVIDNVKNRIIAIGKILYETKQKENREHQRKVTNINRFRVEFEPTLDKINNWRNQVKDKISYLSNVRLPYLYLIPKVHKEPVGSRPIVAQVRTTFKFIDEYLTQLTKFLLINIKPEFQKFIISNSAEAVTIMNQWSGYPATIEQLHKFDVKSMYTNLSRVAIDNAFTNMFSFPERYFANVNFTLHKDEWKIIKILISLWMDTYLIDSKKKTGYRFYRSEDNGIPMGASASPNIANLTMLIFEIEWIRIGRTPLDLRIIRYFDDILLLGDDNVARNIFNAYSSLIPMTKEEFGSVVPFLDIEVHYVKDSPITSKIRTNLYNKSLNTYEFISGDSNILKQHTKGLVLGVANRLSVVCDTKDKFIRKLNFFIHKFQQRNIDFKGPLCKFDYNSARRLQLDKACRRLKRNGISTMREIIDYTPSETFWIVAPIVKDITKPQIRNVLQDLWEEHAPPDILAQTPTIDVAMTQSLSIGRFLTNEDSKIKLLDRRTPFNL